MLPPPRPPPPDFSLSRVKQSSQRLYVALEPYFTSGALPLLKLATWKNPTTSFAYCSVSSLFSVLRTLILMCSQLYWILWYRGLLLSALMLRLLYHIVRWKLHPYPSLAQLREHRERIGRSQTFGTILSTRLAATPALGMRDMWGLFGEYRHLQKLKKKAKKDSKGKNELPADDTASIRDGASASFSTADLTDEHAAKEAAEEADLKRLGLFLLNEVADLLERVKKYVHVELSIDDVLRFAIA